MLQLICTLAFFCFIISSIQGEAEHIERLEQLLRVIKKEVSLINLSTSNEIMENLRLSNQEEYFCLNQRGFLVIPARLLPNDVNWRALHGKLERFSRYFDEYEQHRLEGNKTEVKVNCDEQIRMAYNKDIAIYFSAFTTLVFGYYVSKYFYPEQPWPNLEHEADNLDESDDEQEFVYYEPLPYRMNVTRRPA